MLRGAIAFVLREAVLRIKLVELFHPPVALDLRQDGSGGDRNRPRIPVDQRPLLDGEIEFDGIEQQVIRQGIQLGEAATIAWRLAW